MSSSTEASVRRVVILGATGSIGMQTLDVIRHLNAMADAGKRDERYEVVGLSAGTRVQELASAAAACGDPLLALSDVAAVSELDRDNARRCLSGDDASERLVRETAPDLVVAAIVGIAGLRPTLAAIEVGADVAIANKESLVAAGHIMTSAAQRAGARLLPVDSEHAAAWACLKSMAGPGYAPPSLLPTGLRRLILTASGGAFRDRSRDDVKNAAPADALKHPTWSMGAKVTIDSATLANKALELIEARWLFGLRACQLGVLIHRQSIVHALAEFDDHGVVAQLAAPDMRLPIQSAITAPDLVQAGDWPRLDLASAARLDFEEPDPDRFPLIGVAMSVIDGSGAEGAVFNASNEVAVEAFLAGKLPFGRIDDVVARITDEVIARDASTLDAVLDADARAREATRHLIG